MNGGAAPPPSGLPPPSAARSIQMPQFDANAALAQISTYNQQIADSESNLRAQFESIEMQKEVQCFFFLLKFPLVFNLIHC